MTADLAAGQEKLPFRVEGHVFWQAVAQPENRYVLCLMDPGWVDPADRTAVLRNNLAGTWRASDRMTGKSLGPLGAGLELRVPAGSFRIIDVQQ